MSGAVVVDDKTSSSKFEESSASEGSSVTPFASRESSSSDLSALNNTSNNNNTSGSKPPKKLTTLQERSKVPYSLYVTLAIIGIAQAAGNFWSRNTLESYWNDMSNAGTSLMEMLTYIRSLMEEVWTTRQIKDWKEFMYVGIITTLVASLMHVLIGAPLKAGVWTGPRSRKHKLHRYMGLLYLIQYGAAWIHYLTNYEEAKSTYLTHFIALNGTQSILKHAPFFCLVPLELILTLTPFLLFKTLL